MKVRIKKVFMDKETKVLYKKGEVITMTKKRVEEIQSVNATYIEVIVEPEVEPIEEPEVEPIEEATEETPKKTKKSK